MKMYFYALKVVLILVIILMSFTITLLITICTKNGQKKMYFQKPGKNFQKTYGPTLLGVRFTRITLTF